jgi:hypothetical protein
MPEIVERASGVFLWVKLVIKDLERTASSDAADLEDLRECLRRLPLDLDRYYEETVGRIPRSCRWESYVLLDLVTRAAEVKAWQSAPRLAYLWKAVCVSSCRRLVQAHRILSNLPEDERNDALGFSKRKADDILAWGGGLIEIYEDEDGYRCVQAIHQTVFEFVTSLPFKDIMLGFLAKETYENGHIFHSKYIFATLSVGMVINDLQILSSHCRAAEKTSGCTLVEYLTGEDIGDFFENLNLSPPKTVLLMPPSEPKASHDERSSKAVSLMRSKPPHNFRYGVPAKVTSHVNNFQARFKTPLAFAAYCSLILFLKEWTDGSRDSWQEENTTPLLWCSLIGSQELGHDDFAEVSLLLLTRGYQPIPVEDILDTETHGDLSIIPPIIATLCERGIRNSQYIMRLGLKEVLMALLSNSQHTSGLDSIQIPYWSVIEHHMWSGLRGWCTPLHITTTSVAKELLDIGMDPNSVDSDGSTALDWLFCPPRPLSGELFYLPWISWACGTLRWQTASLIVRELYETSRLLAERGGMVMNRSPKDVTETLRLFKWNGFDLRPFRNIMGIPVPSTIRMLLAQDSPVRTDRAYEEEVSVEEDTTTTIKSTVTYLQTIPLRRGWETSTHGKVEDTVTSKPSRNPLKRLQQRLSKLSKRS